MKKRALFLDRDGVINVDKSYVYKIEDFEFKEGIFELCKLFLSKDYALFVITNQSGIARGFYSEKDFENLSKFMLDEFAKKGIEFKKVYHCPHLEDCECRKPKPGMILRAQAEFNVDLSQSVLIGDNVTDMKAGLNAGIRTLCLVREDLECEFLGYEKRGKSLENSSQRCEYSSEIQGKDAKSLENSQELQGKNERRLCLNKNEQEIEYSSEIQGKKPEFKDDFYKKFSNLNEIIAYFKERL
ncbi:hypothetical protein DMC01_04015 [Campylobacter troglodytis]|nr:hypothetical protein DMC01_04015 [Campylobacter troglodytis]